MNQGLYSLEVLVNGRAVKEYPHGGRVFVEGRDQAQYSLRLRNNTWKRVLAVVSVDGLSVMDGKIAAKNGSGYIINAYSSIEIKGFRESDTSVGSFLFTNKEASYAAGQGEPQNVGVIGVTFVEEKQEPTYAFRHQLIPDMGSTVMDSMSGGDWMEQERERSIPRGIQSKSLNATFSCSVEQPQERRIVEKKADFDMGTTWGKRVTDRVTTVDFKRGHEVATFGIFYASRSSLEAMGVRFIEEKPVAFPQPFPGYAKPPAGWQG